MSRWLVRLLIFGLIAVAAAFVANRLLNQEEDFDDFDDIDAGFEFEETPVEIDVPADDTASEQGAAASAGGTDTARLAEDSDEDRLTSVTGIGPAYEARLKTIGIGTLADLAAADANALNEQLDVGGGVETVQDWIAQAQALMSEAPQAEPGSDRQ